MDVNDTERLLKELNDEMATSMIPVLIYLSILMIAGVAGNCMVVFYYGCKTRRTSNAVFICTVAIFDLLSCCLSIPIEIVDIRFFYMFTNSGACKLLRFVNHITALGSAFTLLMIAADRFRRICRPFKIQLSLQQAKIVCCLSLLVAIFFSWPALIFYDAVKSDLTNEDGVKLQGSDCTTTRDESYKVYLMVFDVMYVLLFITSTIVLCTIYSIIGRVLYKHNQFRKRYTPSEAFGTSPSAVALKAAQSEDETDTKKSEPTEPDKDNNFESNRNEMTVNARQNAFNMKIKNSVDITKDEKTTQEQIDLKTVKYTIIMLVITVVFIVSFLPYLCLAIWSSFVDDFRTYDSSVGYQIGIRSYFLNSALNPITYGFFNSKFRNFFFHRLCPCHRWGKELNTISSSSAG